MKNPASRMGLVKALTRIGSSNNSRDATAQRETGIRRAVLPFQSVNEHVATLHSKRPIGSEIPTAGCYHKELSASLLWLFLLFPGLKLLAAVSNLSKDLSGVFVGLHFGELSCDTP